MRDRGDYGGWIGNLLVPYTRNTQIFQCPSNPKLAHVNDGLGQCARVDGGFVPNAPADEATALQKWGIPYLYVSYGYNYISLWNTGLASVARPADQIAIYDSPFPWGDCPYATPQGDACGVWIGLDIPVFLAKLGLPLHPQMKDPLKPGGAKRYIPYVAPHHNTVNFMFADGHVKAGGWNRMTWGNLDRFIPDSDPDWNVPLTTLPDKRWPGMYYR
jgi:prepilin-type processing-associated H-X9-DG protein